MNLTLELYVVSVLFTFLESSGVISTALITKWFSYINYVEFDMNIEIISFWLSFSLITAVIVFEQFTIRQLFGWILATFKRNRPFRYYSLKNYNLSILYVLFISFVFGYISEFYIGSYLTYKLLGLGYIALSLYMVFSDFFEQEYDHLGLPTATLVAVSPVVLDLVGLPFVLIGVVVALTLGLGRRESLTYGMISLIPMQSIQIYNSNATLIVDGASVFLYVSLFVACFAGVALVYALVLKYRLVYSALIVLLLGITFTVLI